MNTVIQFLKELKQNNQRDWFHENKSKYQEAELEFKELVENISQHISTHDQLESKGYKIFRIYKDVRFSKDKTPYNVHRSVSFKRYGESRRGGYYLRVESGNSFLAGGFWGPEPKDLLHIRKQIQMEPERLRKILKSTDYKNYFPGLEGERVKTSPKGFDKEDPAIDLLRYKQFMILHKFSDKEVLSSDFDLKVSDGFRKMRPFFDYMSEILTTDLNGVSLI